MDINQIQTEGRKIRLELFQKFALIKEGHPGSVLSIFDIVNTLYLGGFIDVQVGSDKNDSFIMSKGHAASVQYPYLVRLGVLDAEEWSAWGEGRQSCLRIFGNRMIPGIDVTSGSLGHGLGIAAGMALADRFDNLSRKHFVVISEGELYEGSTWEALLFIAHNKLNQVKIILDVNRNMILGRPEDLLGLEPLGAKFASFGFDTKRICGHSYQEIYAGLQFLNEKDFTLPRVLIADTIKGKGVSFLEDTAESHYWGGFTDDQIKKMLEDLAL